MLDALVTISIKIGLFVVSCIPTFLLPFYARMVGNALYLCLRREREIIYCQLKFAFPEKSEKELLRIGKESFLSFCLLVLESVNTKKLISKLAYPNDLTKEETGYFKFKDICGINDVNNSKSGAICLVAHCGNFELLAAFFIAKGIPLTTMAREPNYKTLVKIIKDFRASYGLDFLWRDDTGNSMKLLKAIKSGRFLAALIDQDTNLVSVYANFFGHKCAYPKGPLSIAIRMDKPIFMAYDTRLSDGSHKIYTSRIHWEHLKPYKTHEELELFIVNEYSQLLETHIREYPTQWVWWHRRWRRIEGEDPLNPMKTVEYIEYLKEQILLRKQKNKDITECNKVQ